MTKLRYRRLTNDELIAFSWNLRKTNCESAIASIGNLPHMCVKREAYQKPTRMKTILNILSAMPSPEGLYIRLEINENKKQPCRYRAPHLPCKKEKRVLYELPGVKV